MILVRRRNTVVFIGLFCSLSFIAMIIALSKGARENNSALGTPGGGDTSGSSEKRKNITQSGKRNGAIDPYEWHFFDYGKYRREVIAPGDAQVKRGYKAGLENKELTQVFDMAIREVQQRTGNGRYRELDFMGGRYRLTPGEVMEYEVYFRSKESKATDFHVIRLQRTLNPITVEYSGMTSAGLVNIILPYYNRFTTLQGFVERFRKLAMVDKEIVLTIVMYSEGSPGLGQEEQEKGRAFVHGLARRTNQKIRGGKTRVKVVEVKGVFSRGGALMEGANAWDSDEDVILFLCDVDIVFGKNFLQRCRANSQPGQKAYFPIVFSSYSPDIVYGVVKKKPVPVIKNYERKTLISEDNGYWIGFGFGMSCQYLSDFKKLSGPFFNLTGWGLEDVRLYEQFVKSDIEIVRMPDPDLVHVYHKKDCEKKDLGKRFNSCLRSKALNEASKLEWGLWVYKHMGDTSEVEKFLQVLRRAAAQVKASGD